MVGVDVKDSGKRKLMPGLALLAGFVVWTILICHVDVQSVGPNGSEVGFATLNVWFHHLTGVHMLLYTITDWLGLVPIFICMGFGILGFVQLVGRRSLLKVDPDLLLLGAHYVVVILAYLLFEMVPINYRPILIDGVLEASYPSSTTLLVLSVMPTLKYQVDQRVASATLRKAGTAFVMAFSAFMVIGRLAAGVHWATDIIGSVLLSFGLFMTYCYMADCSVSKKASAKAEESDGVQ
jgi:undecaprenyl-diphosphatase